jgi:hypothetical protein
MYSRSALIEALKHYHSGFKAEQNFQQQFLQLLEHPRAYFRDHLPGHITGSALIIDENRQHTLLTHHAKLNRWLQPLSLGHIFLLKRSPVSNQEAP